MSNQRISHLISLQEDGLYLLDLNETTSSKLDLPFTLPPNTESVCILHCRGILCFTLAGNNELAIWGPRYKKIKRIPMVEPGRGNTTNALGFGYDRFSDDYKIVTIIDYTTYIYTFKKGCWRESVKTPSLDYKFIVRSGKVVDNCMYWIANRYHHIKNPDKVHSIMCFDFVNEEYQEWLHPVYSNDKISSWLDFFKGDFCLIDHYIRLYDDMCVWRPERGDKRIKVWNSDPWIHPRKNDKKIKSFDVVYGCIARNDELFIVVKGKGKQEDKVMVYDREKEKFVEVLFGRSLKGFRCMTDYVDVNLNQKKRK